MSAVVGVMAAAIDSLQPCLEPHAILLPMPEPSPKKRTFQAPTGTRDFYPREMLVRRYITDAWRRTALRHGFDEIDGPTFESAELYKVKSGEGILNEMFGVFSGKAEGARRAVEPGAPATGFPDESPDPRNPPFGLRPEFTPTLARMYAARARQLPQPTKWFCVSNFFRAERPQRGRLREFWQWNADVIGGEDATIGDAEAAITVISLVNELGLSSEVVKARIGHRQAVIDTLRKFGVENRLDEHVSFLDDFLKIASRAERASAAQQRNLNARALARAAVSLGLSSAILEEEDPTDTSMGMEPATTLVPLFNFFKKSEPHAEYFQVDYSIVRGLAYYTGTVFEVIAEGERAVAGGGRYDNLIELFGGPPTPACGFGMGDAVLGNLLEDRKLIPEGREMLEALARPMPLRPDVFVIASPNPGCEELIVPTVARLRRGEESEKYKQGEANPWSAERYSVQPLHARRSYKATKNVGKLLADAGACHARFAAIIETSETCSIKNLDTGEQVKDVPLDQLALRLPLPLL